MAGFEESTDPAPLSGGCAGIPSLASCGSLGTLRRFRDHLDLARIPRPPVCRSDDVDPAAASLPVLESRQAAEVLTRYGSAIPTETSREPALCAEPLSFVEPGGAAYPEMAASGFGGLDDQGRGSLRTSSREAWGYIVNEDEGPGVASCRPDVDLRPAHVLGSCPGERKILQWTVVMPDHPGVAALDREVCSRDSGIRPPGQHRRRVSRRRTVSPPGGRVVHFRLRGHLGAHRANSLGRPRRRMSKSFVASNAWPRATCQSASISFLMTATTALVFACPP